MEGKKKMNEEEKFDWDIALDKEINCPNLENDYCFSGFEVFGNMEPFLCTYENCPLKVLDSALELIDNKFKIKFKHFDKYSKRDKKLYKKFFKDMNLRMIEKFKDCAGFGGKPLPYENIDKIIKMVFEIEKLDDVRSIIPLLINQT